MMTDAARQAWIGELLRLCILVADLLETIDARLQAWATSRHPVATAGVLQVGRRP